MTPRRSRAVPLRSAATPHDLNSCSPPPNSLRGSVPVASIGTRAAEFRHRPRMQQGAVAGKAAEDDASQRRRRGQRLDGGRDRDPRRAIGREPVDDGVNAKARDVGDDDFQPRRADLARSKTQAEAAAATVTPLSAKSCWSSPAWNISRMMSQPPTNSPLT